MSRQVCPLCGLDDDVLVFIDDDNPDIPALFCDGPACNGYHWTPKPTTTASSYKPQRTGIGESLDVYTGLLACIDGSAQWLEWGVIEHRYREANPAAYATMVDRWGHRSAGKVSYTASNFLAGCVGQLGREGLIATRHGPTSGYWSYLSQATQAAGLPAPAENAQLLWETYASDLGMNPGVWPT